MAPLTTTHRLWRVLPPRFRRWLVAQTSAAFAPRADPNPPPAAKGLIIAGELSRATGLGEGARLMANAARKLGVPVWQADVSPLLPADTSDFTVNQTPLADLPDAVPIVFHVNPPLLPIVMRRMAKRLWQHRRIIGYWAWELPTIPPEWQVGFRCINDIWVPSRFVADSMRGLTPVVPTVVPHSVTASVIGPIVSSRRTDFGLPRDAIIVMAAANIASSFERKNLLGAVAAFQKAFDNQENRILVLKVGNPEHWESDYDRLKTAVNGSPNIRIDTDVFSRSHLLSFMSVCDIMISLHRSEGFGLFLAEAMLMGKPVIATGWSGNMDFMDDTNSALVKYDLVATNDPRQVYRNGIWAEPDIRDAALKLIWLANDAEARTRLGNAAHDTVVAKLGLDPLAEALRGIGVLGGK